MGPVEGDGDPVGGVGDRAGGAAQNRGAGQGAVFVIGSEVSVQRGGEECSPLRPAAAAPSAVACHELGTTGPGVLPRGRLRAPTPISTTATRRRIRTSPKARQWIQVQSEIWVIRARGSSISGGHLLPTSSYASRFPSYLNEAPSSRALSESTILLRNPSESVRALFSFFTTPP